MSEWRDLSGSELVARLINRGWPPAVARALVARRETPEGVQRLDLALRR